MKCPEDKKRCYIKGIRKEYSEETYEVKCRHGKWMWGDYCPHTPYF